MPNYVHMSATVVQMKAAASEPFPARQPGLEGLVGLRSKASINTSLKQRAEFPCLRAAVFRVANTTFFVGFPSPPPAHPP